MPSGSNREFRNTDSSRVPRPRSFGSGVRSIVSRELETKRATRFTPLTTFGGAAVTQDMFQVAQGIDETERVGNRIRIVGIHYRLRLFNTGNARTYLVRVLIYKRRGAYSTVTPLPVLTELARPVDLNAFVIKMDRFKLLSPRFGSECTLDFNYHKRFPAGSAGAIVQYDGPLRTDIVSGNWQVVWGVSDFFGEVEFSSSIEVFYKDA